MWMKYFPLVILIFVDYCDAEALKSDRQPQIVSAQNFTRSSTRSSTKARIINTYEPTWESLDTRPLPQWYDDAKVGEIKFCVIFVR